MRSVEVPIYDFTTHQRSCEVRHVEPADVVIIEGILVLHIESLRELLNMKIFVDTDDDLRLARRWAAHCTESVGGISFEGILMLKTEHRGPAQQRWQASVMTSAKHKGLQSDHILPKSCHHLPFPAKSKAER